MVFFKIALASMLIVCGFHVAESTFEWTNKTICPIKIPEDTPIKSLHVFAGPSGANNYTVHALNRTDVRQFLIAPNGTLSTLTSFDYENPSDREVALNITAINGTDKASINCTIVITDVNDETPTFTEASYSVSVKSNTSKGARIINVTAIDDDVTPAFKNFTYSIKNETDSNKFSIDTKGAITAATNLTVPSAQNFTITVEASDKVHIGNTSVRVCVGCQTDGLTDSQKKDSNTGGQTTIQTGDQTDGQTTIQTGDQTDGQKGGQKDNQQEKQKGNGGVLSRASLLALVTLLLSLVVL